MASPENPSAAEAWDKFETMVPNRWDRGRLAGVCAWQAARTVLGHPGLIFDQESARTLTEPWALLKDRIFIAGADFFLRKEVGDEGGRWALCEHLAELRLEYGLSPEVPVQEMKRRI